MKDSRGSGNYSAYSERLTSRLRRRLRPFKRLIPFVLVGAVVVIGGLVWLADNYQQMNQAEVTADHSVNVGAGYRNVTYQGKQYTYNNRITTILYAGVDSDTPLTQNATFTMAPRADSISLIVLDELHQKMTIIALSRDTMTEIRRYSLNGKKSGLYQDHLGYAYTYGDGGKASCEGLCEAVSLLLYGVPVSDYVISNRASLSTMSEIIGPVEVTVPNDDLVERNPAFTQGARVVIDSSNLETFVRSRDTTVYFSNVGRMQRQQAYITGAMNRLRTFLTDQPDEFWKSVQTAEDNVQTNITRNRYLELTRVVKNTAFTNQDYYIPEGEQVAGAYHDEFYPDEDLLLDKIIELFYIQN